MAYPLSMTESELIQACLREDRLAQRALYERYNQAMYTLAYRITGDFELANDVLQEAFVKVFQHLAHFRRESTLGAWIKTIVLRTAISKVKRQQVFDPEEAIPADYALDWGDFIEAEYLQQAINSLPPGYRTVFVLIEVEGYSHQEVADLLGISTGTSKSQLFYAKKRLRETLKKML
ncbi:MAG: RNA polymerase sigma factor [Haliscomenobacter sp.]|jgi:RNA polymerase sigma factor (sigma-70 family)